MAFWKLGIDAVGDDGRTLHALSFLGVIPIGEVVVAGSGFIVVIVVAPAGKQVSEAHYLTLHA